MKGSSESFINGVYRGLGFRVYRVYRVYRVCRDCRV